MACTKKGKAAFDPSLKMWLKFIRAYSVYRQKAADDMKNYGLNLSQFWVIECLGSLGPLIMGELCKKTFLSTSNMTFIVDGLEKTGLVERVFAKEDRRAVLVRLTPKGEAVYDEAFYRHSDFLSGLATVLTKKEQEDFARILKKLGLALADMA